MNVLYDSKMLNKYPLCQKEWSYRICIAINLLYDKIMSANAPI